MMMPVYLNSCTCRFRQRGLSLIELMVSITIGLLLLVSLSSMFINQSRARTELDKANRMIDNGRYALDLLSSNLRIAGYFASFEPTGAATTIYDPCSTIPMTDPAQSLDLLRVAVQGYDASSTAAQVSSPPCSLTYTAGSPETLKSGSDILVLRRVSTAALTQNAAATLGINGSIYMQVSSCQYDTVPYMISNNPSAMMLGQRNINGTNNCFSSVGITTITAPYEAVRPFKVEVYFVSPDNNAGDGIPTLKRRELTYSLGSTVFVTTPLVEGIEFMQVEYGIDDPALDTDGVNGIGLDGAPDFYSTCSACTPEQWSNVVSVKLNLIARNTESTTGYTDPNTYTLGQAGDYTPSGDDRNFKRHAYTQTIRLTNPSSRRETP